MRVLFWGTSDFALPTLRGVRSSSHELVGVVTQPDRPAGRGRELRPTPVKRVAEQLGAAILQPERPRGDGFLERLSELAPDVSVVAAYGEILTEPVLELPERGSVNVHASLLPELRGAAPVNWAVIRGHERSGVTIMRMVRELDAGPILEQVAVELGPRVTAGALFERLADLGAAALVGTLDRMERGPVGGLEQDDERATYAPKLGRDEARVDWSEPAVRVDARIRGCDPWPAAWSELVRGGEGEERSRKGDEGGQRVQLFGSRPGPETGTRLEPGTVARADPRDGLLVAAGTGLVEVGEVKPAGRSRMPATAWIQGRGVASGDRFR